MKHFVVFVVLLAACTLAGRAQSSIRVGLQAGMVYSDADISGRYWAFSTKFRHGFTVQALTEFPVYEFISVVVAPGYIQRGFVTEPFERRDEANRFLGNFESEILLNDIEFPAYVLFRAMSEGFSPFLFIGKSFTIRASARTTVRPVGPVEGGAWTTIPVSDDYQTFDEGFLGGLGFDIPLGKRAVMTVSGRYSRSFLNANKHNGLSYYFYEFSMTGGLKFNISSDSRSPKRTPAGDNPD